MPDEKNRSRLVTRFAPSPTGRLHKGHAYSALQAYRRAKAEGGRFLLRIEDIDTVRCKPEFTDGIYEDLAWLGLTWEEPVRVQSEHFCDYKAALTKLQGMGLIYPCFCTRREITASTKKDTKGPDGPLYPGTCRNLTLEARLVKVQAGIPHAWRLDTLRALQSICSPLRGWTDELQGPQVTDPLKFGDVTLARKDTPTSYHLSVVVDDALEGITHIIRGMDLYEATHIHVLLQQLLGLKTPMYHHHSLLLEETGEKFSKRNKSVTIESLRRAGIKAENIVKL